MGSADCGRIRETCADRQGTAKKANSNKLFVAAFPHTYRRSLLGLSIAWFIYDFITYPFGLFSSVIVDTITGSSTKLTTVLAWNLVINAFYLPGAM
jgi:hypothetical protein